MRPVALREGELVADGDHCECSREVSLGPRAKEAAAAVEVEAMALVEAEAKDAAAAAAVMEIDPHAKAVAWPPKAPGAATEGADAHAHAPPQERRAAAALKARAPPEG